VLKEKVNVGVHIPVVILYKPTKEPVVNIEVAKKHSQEERRVRRERVRVNVRERVGGENK
tara:strand:- start:263 stop:442 length:180 start_codon:yes stop_codon:yes gene_type:complete